MNKKDLNYLLMTLGVFRSKQLDTNSNINDDTHFTDSFEKTNEIITNELNDDEVKIALMAKQTEFLKSIKNIIFLYDSFCDWNGIDFAFCIKSIYLIDTHMKSNHHSILLITSFP